MQYMQGRVIGWNFDFYLLRETEINENYNKK